MVKLTKKPSERKKTFFKNAFILSVTSVILRSVGIFFRIFLSNKIGAEGMGLYQLIISAYVLAATFATSGIITAVTRLVSEQSGKETKKSVRHILARAIALSLSIGIASSLIFIFGADIISQYAIGDMRASLSLKILSIGLPFMGVSSCLKGYFIARRAVSNNTSSQLLEQAVRIGVIVLVIDKLSVFGVAGACAAVMIGDTIAEIVSTIHLMIVYFISRRKIPNSNGDYVPRKGVFKKLLHIAVPITAGRYMSTALRTVENLLVPNTITQYTGSRTEALSQFGFLKGMALPLVLFPCSFLSSFSTLLIPEISEARAHSNKLGVQKVVRQALKVTLLFAFPVAVIFLLFSNQIGLMVYKSEYVGYIIRMLVPIIPLMYLESVIDGILKGLDQQVSSLKYSVLDSAARIIAIIFVLPRYGMFGFLLIMYGSNILTCGLNVRRLLKVSGEKIKWIDWVIMPLFCSLGALFAGILSCKVAAVYISSQVIQMIIGTVIIVAVYLIFVIVSGVLKKDDFSFFKRSKTSNPQMYS